jgi:head-tail adaptor
MAYSTGLLKHRIQVFNRKEAQTSQWGKDGSGIEWEEVGCVWAAVDYVRGVRAMREGALDVYGVVMVRMRWNPVITLRSRIQYDGKMYQILGETFHAEPQENTIQFNAQIIINDK